MRAAFERRPTLLQPRVLALLAPDLVTDFLRNKDQPARVSKRGGQHPVEIGTREVDTDHRIEHTDRILPGGVLLLVPSCWYDAHSRLSPPSLFASSRECGTVAA